jgi:Na+/proline symporter
MRERTPGAVQTRGAVGSKTGVWIGRVLGLIIIVLAIAIGFNASDIATENEGWAFFHAATTPLGIGFLIMVAAEILDRVDEWLKYRA